MIHALPRVPIFLCYQPTDSSTQQPNEPNQRAQRRVGLAAGLAVRRTPRTPAAVPSVPNWESPIRSTTTRSSANGSTRKIQAVQLPPSVLRRRPGRRARRAEPPALRVHRHLPMGLPRCLPPRTADLPHQPPVYQGSQRTRLLPMVFQTRQRTGLLDPCLAERHPRPLPRALTALRPLARRPHSVRQPPSTICLEHLRLGKEPPRRARRRADTLM